VAAALVSRVVDASVATGPLPQIVVADTERALADFAAAVQRDRSNVKVVGITGSNGKTSVKTLAMAVLSRAGHALRQSRQPQQRDRPAAGGARCARGRAVRRVRDGRRQAG
jgi:UDP-N-acetylmuramyl pentapeptide synthase